PALWLITEWARGWFLTGFPWLNIGTSQTDSLLANYAAVIGDYGISFIVCVFAASIVSLFINKLKTKIISASILLFIFIASLLLENINWTEA
ncbi:MAG: apolipoprotein N-acyltransferase, partial [Gammaproteobacteria bacterium]